MVDAVVEDIVGPSDDHSRLAPLDQTASRTSNVEESIHPVDLRLTIPLWPKKYYFVILAGEERRNAQRRKKERTLRPLATLGNLLFLAAMSIGGTIVGGVLFTWLIVQHLSL